jgi:hypothetical protein
MFAGIDTSQRLKELIAKIESEQNPRTFSVLVEELNQLLDGDKSVQSLPATNPESTPARHKNTSATPGSAVS